MKFILVVWFVFGPGGGNPQQAGLVSIGEFNTNQACGRAGSYMVSENLIKDYRCLPTQ